MRRGRWSTSLSAGLTRARTFTASRCRVTGRRATSTSRPSSFAHSPCFSTRTRPRAPSRSDMLAAYAVHFLLECLGQVVLFVAYKHVCRKDWHRVAIWLVGTLLTTIITVNLI